MGLLPVARREARERALSLLYEAESKDVSPETVVAELPVKPDAFATGLVMGVGSEQARIDSLISAHAIGWAMDRMPVVDRALLRMATYELLDHEDVPTAVIISEAVDLATQYSTDESGRFVNGVLAAIATDVRGETVPAPDAGDRLERVDPVEPPAPPV
jgi:transcription antitermination protein NusB